MERGSRDYVYWSLGIALVVLFALIPVIWLISLSLKPPEAIADQRFIPSEISFDNYKSLFEGGIDESPFIKPLINSILIALITTVIAIVLASFAAYAIARLEFPGKRLILAGALAIAMFPPISTVGPLFDMWRALGLYDTYPGLIIPYLTFSLPLAIYVLVAFFREIPWDLEQAAQVDGATPFQAFTKVIVPLAAPGVFTAAILVFIFCWNDFLFAISLTSSDASRTVPAALAFFTGESSFTAPTGSIAAAAPGAIRARSSSPGSPLSSSNSRTVRGSRRASQSPKPSHTSCGPSSTPAARTGPGAASAAATSSGSGTPAASSGTCIEQPRPTGCTVSGAAPTPRSRMNAQPRTESLRSRPSWPRSKVTDSWLPRSASGSSSRPPGASWATHSGRTSELPTVSTIRS